MWKIIVLIRNYASATIKYFLKWYQPSSELNLIIAQVDCTELKKASGLTSYTNHQLHGSARFTKITRRLEFFHYLSVKVGFFTFHRFSLVTLFAATKPLTWGINQLISLNVNKVSNKLPDIGAANKGIKESSVESKESTLDCEVVAFVEQDGKKTIKKKKMRKVIVSQRNFASASTKYFLKKYQNSNVLSLLILA